MTNQRLVLFLGGQRLAPHPLLMCLRRLRSAVDLLGDAAFRGGSLLECLLAQVVCVCVSQFVCVCVSAARGAARSHVQFALEQPESQTGVQDRNTLLENKASSK